MTYEIRMTRKAEKALLKIEDKKQREKILQKIYSLSENPTPEGSKKLSGYKIPTYRIRYRGFRIAYRIHNDQLFLMVLIIENRDDVYKDLKRFLDSTQ